MKKGLSVFFSSLLNFGFIFVVLFTYANIYEPFHVIVVSLLFLIYLRINAPKIWPEIAFLKIYKEIKDLKNILKKHIKGVSVVNREDPFINSIKEARENYKWMLYVNSFFRIVIYLIVIFNLVFNGLMVE